MPGVATMVMAVWVSGMVGFEAADVLVSVGSRVIAVRGLQMMVRHHQGAVDVAKTELAQGANPESKELAQSIIDSQSAEIAEMNSILAGIPG